MPTTSTRITPAGVPSQPNVFYAGYDNGGLSRTTDYGSTWTPIFLETDEIVARWNVLKGGGM